MYAIQAVYDGKNFKPKQPILLKGSYEVIITFIEPVKKSRSEMIGFLKDKVWMSEDFDKPIEEMQEYME